MRRPRASRLLRVAVEDRLLISSAAVAVTIATRKAGQHNWTIAFAVISAIFLYTTVVYVIERPDGVRIGACFIAGIILVSCFHGSRAPSSCGSPA